MYFLKLLFSKNIFVLGHVDQFVQYCHDPFEKHQCRIYLHFRVASEQLIADCPSLSLRSGDLLCVNCLKAVQNHRSEVASEHAGPSGLSQECAQPSISTPYSSKQDSISSSDIHLPGSKQNAFLT